MICLTGKLYFKRKVFHVIAIKYLLTAVGCLKNTYFVLDKTCSLGNI